MILEISVISTICVIVGISLEIAITERLENGKSTKDYQPRAHNTSGVTLPWLIGTDVEMPRKMYDLLDFPKIKQELPGQQKEAELEKQIRKVVILVPRHKAKTTVEQVTKTETLVFRQNENTAKVGNVTTPKILVSSQNPKTVTVDKITKTGKVNNATKPEERIEMVRADNVKTGIFMPRQKENVIKVDDVTKINVLPEQIKPEVEYEHVTEYEVLFVPRQNSENIHESSMKFHEEDPIEEYPKFEIAPKGIVGWQNEWIRYPQCLCSKPNECDGFTSLYRSITSGPQTAYSLIFNHQLEYRKARNKTYGLLIPCSDNKLQCCISKFETIPYIVGCGIHPILKIEDDVIKQTFDQERFGGQPWQALILTTDNKYIAIGVLIDQRHVITVAHRIHRYKQTLKTFKVSSLRIHLGDWEIFNGIKGYSYQIYNVDKLFVHDQFSPKTLVNDVVLLRTKYKIPITPQSSASPIINRACLPQKEHLSYEGIKCKVYSFDTHELKGHLSTKMKELEVEVITNEVCVEKLKAGKMNISDLDETFLCAKSKQSDDVCTNDGGSGLMCEIANQPNTLIGLVSWGMGCAKKDVPGVYTNIAKFIPWINEMIAEE